MSVTFRNLEKTTGFVEDGHRWLLSHEFYFKHDMVQTTEQVGLCTLTPLDECWNERDMITKPVEGYLHHWY